MPRDEDMERRLLQWAQWCEAKAGSGGFARANLLEVRAASGYREAIIPIDQDEASITDAAVKALDGPLRAAVEAWYLRGLGRGGASAAETAAARLCITLRTLHNRVAQAHVVLGRWFSERAALRRAREENDAKIRDSARP